MIINNLSVENVGLFRGKHTFNLKPTDSKNGSKSIILVGGKNGSGKTTFFEAVRLCLYGPNFQEKRLSKSKYESYLADKIHRIPNSDEQPLTSSIEVEFEYSHLGKVDNYLVKRSWERNSKKIIENLLISRNGTPLEELEIDQWQEFLTDLIPPGISQLFFFDGEKIQYLAEDDDNKSHLKESFNSLLGLDLVDKLRTDLGIYVARQSKEAGVEGIEKHINEIEVEIGNVERNLDVLYQNRAQKQSLYDKIVGDIERQELKISNEGGTFATKREDLKLERTKLDTEIEAVNNQIRELSFNLLPFAVTPKFCKLLRNQIIEEGKYQEWVATKSILGSKKKEINLALRSTDIWDGLNITPSTQKNIAEILSEIVNEKLTPSEDYNGFKSIHQFSTTDRQKMLTWIDSSLNTVPHQMKKHTTKLEKLIRKRQKVEKALIQAPEDDVLFPLIQKMNELNVELGSLTEQIREIDEEVRKMEFNRDDSKRKLNVQYDKLKAHGNLSERLVLADKVRNSLNDYTLALRKEKINEFSEVFLTCFNSLSRKDDFLERIDINENDFSITLYEHGNQIIQKHQLSAGEKQIYAISMLWALTLISGRPLPFIIDTPLGRLDADHRSTLVSNFFPHASHQMIIFSTDTEVDQSYFNELLPHISRAYHMEYSSKDRMTEVAEGYFWNLRGDN